ncbi:MAG: Hsp20/alpha crystallin family protein [Polyangiaceae bacterium]
MLDLFAGGPRPLHHELTLFDQLLRVRPALTRHPSPDESVSTKVMAPDAMRRWPSVNIVDTGETTQLDAVVPGFRAEDIQLSFENETLEIEGKLDAKEPADDEGKPDDHKILFSEHRQLNFKRRFRLGVDVDADRIEATMENGVLTVVLPKVASVSRRTIAITTAS